MIFVPKSLVDRVVNRCPKTGRIIGYNFKKMSPWFFPLVGVTALLWFLIRVLPKPSRVAYPCIKIAAPLASSFVVWFLGFTGSFFIFKRARQKWQHSRFAVAALLLAAAAFVFSLTLLPANRFAYSDVALDLVDPYGPNNPVGQPKGILPGRVVWAWNPAATNEKCVPDKIGDGYFLDKNCDQVVVDDMLASALLQLTGAADQPAAWETVFRFFNQNHGKGDVGYTAGETIFIKVNAVHAWNTRSDGSIQNNGDYGNVDTSPQAVHAMLRQLVHQAGVPQENIYIGDPFTHIFNHCYDKWRAEFPNVHYMDKNGLNGREKYRAAAQPIMFFSDHGAVLRQTEDRYYTAMQNADYLLNIPAMKGHRWGGVTLFGKNFFGANTRSGADHMHPGLHRENYDEPLRGQYGMYRVFVDLLGHKDLGGKILIYFMDALWSCSYEHEPPVKFQTAPFNNDWTSSILLSLDPLAIESVCLDILQAEFPKTESEVPGNYWYANFPAIDDYLHQAADSTNWPEGLVYDPENDGTPVGSLGVHEHWNNPVDQQYSRNLGAGQGIELVKIFTTTPVAETGELTPGRFELAQNYPNPFNMATEIRYNLERGAKIQLAVYNTSGQLVRILLDGFQQEGERMVDWDGLDATGNPVTSGVYFYRLTSDAGYGAQQQTKMMTLLK